MKSWSLQSAAIFFYNALDLSAAFITMLKEGDLAFVVTTLKFGCRFRRVMLIVVNIASSCSSEAEPMRELESSA